MRLSFLICATLVASATAWSDVVSLPKTTDKIRIDGVIDEAAWQSATRLSLDVETRPGENIPARVQTTALLIEDGNSLYVAFDARDPDPAAIRAFFRDRDSVFNNDLVGVVLDTYNDGRRSFELFSNPLGVQLDLTNDDVRKNEDTAWDAIWDSAGKITDQGYVVEMRIPFSQLSFPLTDGEQTWGFNLLRFYPRADTLRLARSPVDRELGCGLCQIGEIRGFAGVRPSRNLQVVPTLTATNNEITDEPGVVPLDGSGTEAEVGVSIRWGITPDTTANFAINPDFSQVEADAAQLDVNNQFALFFPERRPFFLENADYFSTPLRAVFTRTIADPSVGAKVTGKRGDHTYGLFAAEDDVTNLLFPGAQGSSSDVLERSNQALVGRYSRGFGDASSVGVLWTSRDASDYHNRVAGLDLNWRITEQHEVLGQYLFSDTAYPTEIAVENDQPLDSFTGHAAVAGYNYRSRDWSFYARHRDFSSGFRADSGFITRADAETQIAGGARRWIGDQDDWYNQLEVSGDWDITHDEDGQLLEREVELEFGISATLQSEFEVEVFTRDRLFEDILFEEKGFELEGEFTPVSGFKAGLSLQWSDQIDFANARLGEQFRIDPSVTWNVNRHLLLSFDASFVALDTTGGEQIFDAAVYDFRATWQFNRRSFLRLTTQMQDVERNPDVYRDEVDRRSRDVGAQLLYSWTLNPQTVFFLGYSDSRVDDDDLERLTTDDRTWFMKIGYAWEP
ncbi:MAG: carbohydrate binding family 9 domain-containing protein [Woeseiaceae bacterium]|nr:carbohydrate binding family 9 domain-containing protein [Woeseiaceae bacterium]